jgi:hypothetical protein
VDKETLKIGRNDLRHFGKLLVRFVVEEAKKDASKSSFIPTSKDFYESFSYRVVGNGVDVTSNWPWIDLIVQGTKGPYPMKWLTRAQGVDKVPLISKEGQVVIRSTPLTTDKAWIHPKIAQHTFIRRAFDRARVEFAKLLLSRNSGEMLRKVFENE